MLHRLLFLPIHDPQYIKGFQEFSFLFFLPGMLSLILNIYTMITV
jgi:hypothetical protein